MHSGVGQAPAMQTPYERLQHARRLAEFEEATEAANAMGVAVPTYLGHENGSRGFKRNAERYAQFFRVSYEWLMTGKGEPRPASLDARARSLPPEERRQLLEYFDFLESRAGIRRAG